jgi:hypothetical protein
MNHIFSKQTRKKCTAGIAAVLFAAVLIPSCNYLNIDSYIDEEMKYDSIFSNKRYIEAYMWDAATIFPDEGAIFRITGPGEKNMYTPGPLATDEAFSIHSMGDFVGMAYVLGGINADNITSWGEGTFCRWDDYYRIIRQCNIIFSRIDEAKDWTATERLKVLAYTRFMRAYAYYNILADYGPAIIVHDEVLNNNDDMAYYDRPRDLYDDCVEYVCAEFEKAAEYLEDAQPSILEYGRPTKGAAYALVARLRLIHASPLFNGGQAARSYYGNWTRKTDGAHYIAQQYDPRRWAVAAAAAKRVMDMTIAGKPAYRLHTVEANDDTRPLPPSLTDPGYSTRNFPDGAADIDPYHSYADMFNGETVMSINPEFIWARTSASLTGSVQCSFPVAHGGTNDLCLTQKVVDAYETSDGRAISEAGDLYTETGFLQKDTTFSEYRLKSGVSNMYVNREMRFYASVGFSERFWTCSSTTESSHKNQTVTYYYNSANGRTNTTNPGYYPITGYVLTKYVHPIDAWAGVNSRQFNKPFPIIRYAEILLSYAEALNNIEGSFDVEINGVSHTFTRNSEEIRKAINQIRYRSGLPGLSETEAADPDYVMSKIKKERMVEFLCENRRYFDVRRWGEYETSESEPIMGMNTAANKDSFYQRVIPNSVLIGYRIINRRLVFLPIPKIDTKRMPSLDQNPGW